jgi:cation diffusion facilitator family transporter
LDRLIRIALGSIGVSIVVLALKGLAWWVTGSAALFSDALESIVNVAAAVMALGAIRLSAQPPDANHPYGHAKAELFAAAVEGGMIVTAAVLILQHAWFSFRHPAPLHTPWRGIGINAAATLLNLGWAWFLLRRGRAARSPALLAEGRHLVTDVVTSAGLAVGLGLALATGVLRLDPALAALVAVYILCSGAVLARDSLGGLMDEAPHLEVVQRIESLVAGHAAGALQAHDIRTRLAGRQTFLQFHLVVPGSMTVLEAHEICDRIEAGISAAMPQVVTTIHVEPDGKAKAQADGVLVL